MIQLHFYRFLISSLLFLSVCFGTSWIINPQSFVNFVGPCAALLSGLILIWGAPPVIAVIVISPLLAFGLKYLFQVDANLSVMSIAVLAIVLQGIWTRHLVFRFIHYKKWITSRKHLFFFILRIGPIASLVSASAVVIIAILDNKIMQGSFLYAFATTWSTSMLVAVFLIPLLLLAKNAEKFKLAKRIFVGVTSILGGLAIFLLLKTSQYEQQNYRQALFKQSKTEIERVIIAEIETVVNKINSISALFKARDNVTLTEFSLFSESILNDNSSVRALEWAPIISSEQRKKFEQETTLLLRQNFYIKERLKNGDVVIAPQRRLYAPLRYIYPLQGNQVALGLDTLTNPEHILSMQHVFENKGIVASAPISLIQDKRAKPGMLFSTAIFSNTPDDNSNERVVFKKLPSSQTGRFLGFVVAVVQFDPFFQRLAKEKNQQVSLFIQDITNSEPFALFGQKIPEVNRHFDTFTIPMFSRIWQVSIAEKKPWFSQSKSWQAWAVLLGGTFGGVLFQMLVLMMAAYSSELSLQVDIKTRALILAKERSDRNSLAKSRFLQTLNTELRMPLLAIKAFVDQLKQKGIHNKQVSGIHHAGNNVGLLLDTMMDLSDIESGKIIAKKDCFDFYGFLQRTEALLKASSIVEGKSVIFLIDSSVPHYLNSDELYIHKLINALIEGAHHLLKVDALRLSIKLHKHKSAAASLFFTLSPQDTAIEHSNESMMSQRLYDELIADSTAMAMAIKYSQLLNGDAHLGSLSSGAGVLSASVRVTVSSIEQQEEQQGLTFDLL